MIKPTTVQDIAQALFNSGLITEVSCIAGSTNKIKAIATARLRDGSNEVAICTDEDLERYRKSFIVNTTLFDQNPVDFARIVAIKKLFIQLKSKVIV